MTLSAAEVGAVVEDLRPRLEGARVERIDQPDRHRLVLTIRRDRWRYQLLFCTHPRFSRLHLLTARPERGKPAAGFCKVARDHLTTARVESLRQVNGDRVVAFDCIQRDRLMHAHRVSLVAELVGVGSNLLVLDETGRVLAALCREESARRKILPGLQYQPLASPVTPSAKALVNRFEEASDPQDPLALSRAIQSYYAGLEAEETLEMARRELAAAVRRALEQRRARLGKLEEESRRAQEAESLRRKGELLKIALPGLRAGQRQIQVEDLFDPMRPLVTIELDPSRSAEANMHRLFERYKKAKAGAEKLAARLEATRREAAALEALQSRVAAASSLEQVSSAAEEAKALGAAPARRPAAGPRREGPSGPRSFRSADGTEILVARNRKENARLTFSIAHGNDWWLHLRAWPGPHVIMRTPADRTMSQEALLDAAHLAVYFSRLRGTDWAEVTYTQCKHVRRLKGAPAGTVSYAQAATIHLRVEPERLERLLKSRAGPDEPGGAAP
jgi:predicted ribosome quality control (RQC) complex YloA/Tae2 family protein